MSTPTDQTIRIAIPAALLAMIGTCIVVERPAVAPIPDVVGIPDGGIPTGEGEGEGEGETSHTGLHFDGAALRDGTGAKIVIRGINHTLWWGWKEHNEEAVAEIGKTGANAIRLVFGSGMGHSTPAEQRRAIAAATAAGMVPIVENHDATCKTDRPSIDAVVQWWLDPMRIAYTREFPDLIVNIANEWGPFDGKAWSDAYVDAVRLLRAAGIANPILIDAGGACGQNPRSVRDNGAAIVAADVLRNVGFSVHMYAYWRTAEATDVGRWNDSGTQSPWRIEDELKSITAKGLYVVVGEIGWQGSPQVGYKTQAALDTLANLGIGWIAWSWNQNSDSALDMVAYGDPALYLYDPAHMSEGGCVFLHAITR